MDEKDKHKKAIVSVKGDKNIHADMIRDLCHVVDREKAEFGIFITLENPTKAMELEANESGFYKSPLGTSHPKTQILTIEQLLQKKKPDIPPQIASIQTQLKIKKQEGAQTKMSMPQ